MHTGLQKTSFGTPVRKWGD